MDKIGAQEFLLPALLPSEVWKASGRWEAIGEEMFRLRDRGGAELCLGMTHEEVFTWLARELRSYKELPQIWYQIQLKFRDEPRPKSGLLRVREFAMKDSYSFDLDAAGLDFAFQQHFRALPAHLRALRARAPRRRGILGHDGRRRVGRVHGRERGRRGLDRVLRRLRLRGERREGDLGAARRRGRRRGLAAPGALRDARAFARSSSSPASRAARRPSARSRRSSTCSTER